MTVLRAYDAASPAVSIDAMKQHGGIVAPVYIVGNPGGFQPSDARRVDALRAAGIAPWPNWERAADFFAHCTLAEAKAAGAEARLAAQRCGFPDDGTISIPFSFDYQVMPTRYPDAVDKLKACQDGLGAAYLATSYAQSGLIRYFGKNGFDRTGHWLMASTWGLPDFDTRSPLVAIIQSHEADGSWLTSPIPGTDANTVTRPEKLAAWWPDGSPYGGDMALDANDPVIVALNKRLDGLAGQVQDANTRLYWLLNGGGPAEATDAQKTAWASAGLRDLAPVILRLQQEVAALKPGVGGTLHVDGDLTVSQ